MQNKDLIEALEQQQIRLVRFIFCDLANIIRGKNSHIGTLADRLESGIGIVKGSMAVNMHDQLQLETGFGATGEVRIVPDLTTLKILPYVPNTAQLICDLVELDRKPWSMCPRSALKRQIARAAERGMLIEAAFEPEFYVGTESNGTFAPIDKGGCFSTESMNRGANFIDSFIGALESQELTVEQYYPELGQGQHELSIRHAPALQAADNQIAYRETLRGVGTQQGLFTTVAAKPFPASPGSGCHLHLSAWSLDKKQNLFQETDGLSKIGKQFVAGILKHLDAIVALCCSSVNSYRRLQPNAWSSAYVCWGYENREAAVRVPTLYWGKEKETTNIEIKCVDSSSNPYLALCAIIAAGLDGIDNELEPPRPVSVEPGSLSREESKECGILRLPDSLEKALAKLKVSTLSREALGEDLFNSFLVVKSSEVVHFAKQSQTDEARAHWLKY